MCQAFYHILRSSKTRFTQGRLFCPLGPLFCGLVREKAVFAICKRCANEGFACMCKENVFYWHLWRFFPCYWVKFTQVRLTNFPIHISLNSCVEGSNYHIVWWKLPHSVLIFFVCINVAKFAISVWRFSPHCVVKFTIAYGTNFETVYGSR